jgi:predicted nucleotidyltransferase
LPRIEGDLAEALRLLRDYFERRQIPFALVGALVPALLLSSEIGARETRDADHVIRLDSWAAWETVIADLEKLGFARGRGEQEHRLYYRTAEIDLIPFGISDGPDDVLIWPKSGNHMNLTGFADVFRYATAIEVTPGVMLPVVPLWLFAVLKVIAYLDRQFPRDLRDLVYVLEQYEPIGQSSRRFDLAGEVEGVTYENAGAYLLGRDVQSNASAKALELVRDFTAQTTDEHHSLINVILRDENRLFSDERREAVFRLIASFRQGLASA